MDFLNDNDSSRIVNPSLRIIDNCKYRTYDLESQTKTANVELEPYLDNEESLMSCTEIEDDAEIYTTKSGKFVTKFHAPSQFFGSIIGTRGARKREIEQTTCTEIKIPRHNETGDIVISGTTERNVASARLRVSMIVLQCRESKPVTHFVTVPVVSMGIMQNFITFKQAILNGPPLRGVDESIFQTVEKLHLTITPLVLLDQDEIEVAVTVLHQFQTTLRELFQNSGPLKIILKGLEIMNDDPTEVDVLYGKVVLNVSTCNEQFQKMANIIQSLFSAKGLTRRQDGVKLHVTLLNSLFRKRGETATRRERFDASDILSKFKDYYFGEVDFHEIALAIRYTVAENKFYEKQTTIDLQV